MSNLEFAEILKNINEELQQIKIPNLFHCTEGNLTEAQKQKQELIQKIAKIRKNCLTN